MEYFRGHWISIVTNLGILRDNGLLFLGLQCTRGVTVSEIQQAHFVSARGGLEQSGAVANRQLRLSAPTPWTGRLPQQAFMFSLLWRFESLRSGCWLIWFLVRALFLSLQATTFLLSPPVAGREGGGMGEGKREVGLGRGGRTGRGRERETERETERERQRKLTSTGACSLASHPSTDPIGPGPPSRPHVTLTLPAQSHLQAPAHWG